MHLPKNIMLQAGLWLAVAIDGLLNVPFFLAISTTPLIQVAFFAMAALAVLFKVFTLLQNWKVLWAMLAFVTLFASLSMALNETTLNKQVSIAAESQDIKEAKLKSQEANRTWLDLQEQFKQASKQTTMELLAAQIKEARELYQRAEAKVDSLGKASNKVFADEVLRSILYAFPDRAHVFILFFIMLLSLEAVIYATATGIAKQAREANDANQLVKEEAISVEQSEATEAASEIPPEQPRGTWQTTSSGSSGSDTIDNSIAGNDSGDIFDSRTRNELVELVDKLDKKKPTKRAYFLRAWPDGNIHIKQPAIVAKENDYDLNACQALHDELFEGFIAENFMTKAKPKLTRSEYLKLKRPL